MKKGRLEAFSDGVLAIVLTIMVLEMKVPHGASLEDLRPVFPVFVSYVLSFAYVGIYWNNHHHMLHSIKQVDGKVLWANLHLLFWLSLTPFVTGWMGENHFELWPVVLYGAVFFMAAVAYYILARTLVSLEGKDSLLAQAIGSDWKGKISLALCAAGIGLAFVHPLIGWSMYVVVAIVWFIPDKRIEARLNQQRG